MVQFYFDAIKTEKAYMYILVSGQISSATTNLLHNEEESFSGFFLSHDEISGVEMMLPKDYL